VGGLFLVRRHQRIPHQRPSHGLSRWDTRQQAEICRVEAEVLIAEVWREGSLGGSQARSDSDPILVTWILSPK
jgi:hypothetical protein